MGGVESVFGGRYAAVGFGKQKREQQVQPNVNTYSHKYGNMDIHTAAKKSAKANGTYGAACW